MSFISIVMVVELAPSAGMLAGSAVILMVPTATGLMKVTVVVSFMSPYTAVTVAVPAVVGAMSVVLAMPLLSVVTVAVWMVPECGGKGNRLSRHRQCIGVPDPDAYLRRIGPVGKEGRRGGLHIREADADEGDGGRIGKGPHLGGDS